MMHQFYTEDKVILSLLCVRKCLFTTLLHLVSVITLFVVVAAAVICLFSDSVVTLSVLDSLPGFC